MTEVCGVEESVIVIVKAVTTEWDTANRFNDTLVKAVLKQYGADAGAKEFQKYFNNNDAALKAFINRKQKGFSLSKNIWNQSDDYIEGLETAISAGFSEGISAVSLAGKIKQYLNDPDKLFRRVRDRYGNLKPSKPMRAYRTERGKYRSSYKNALRLARTETNMAYRTADNQRWQQLDFVVGFEVKRSGRFYDCDLCESLKGKYPKDFLFTGWHPNCRCYQISILNTEEEFWNDAKESINEVTGVPDSFKQWVKENSDRIEQAEQRGTLPYFLKDNHRFVDEIMQDNSKHFISISDELKEKFKKIGIDDVIMNAGDENYAKWINDGLSELKDLGYEIPEIVGISTTAFENIDALAYFDSSTNALVFNGNYTLDELIKITKDCYDSGYYSTSNEFHIIRHEVGHWLHSNFSKKSFEKLKKSNISFTFAGKEVSERATIDALEFVSEVFSGIIDGKKYSNLVINLYKTLGGI